MLMASTIEVFTERDPSKIVRKGDFYAAMFVVLAGGCLVSYFTLGFASNIIAQETSHNYRRQGMTDALRQDIEFFDREENSAGAFSSRVDGYATNIMELTSFKIGLIMISILSLLACSALALSYSWKLGLVVVLAGLPPLVASGYLKIRIEATQDRQSSQRYSKSASLASESITFLRTVSSLCIEKDILQRYSNDLDKAVSQTKRPLCWVMLCFGFMQAVEFWFLALGFW
jgi:ATP-binding cassette subfamily B (MDR/TAP) protein 1